MNPENGLYNRYNLYIGYLIKEMEYDFDSIVNEQHDISRILSEITKKEYCHH